MGFSGIDLEKQRDVWRAKPQLRRAYEGFYRRLAGWVDPELSGAQVEIGSGIGALRGGIPQAVLTDLVWAPWLDLVADAYRLPYQSSSVSHLFLVDVFHHLQRPQAFLYEARRVLRPEGKLLMLEPYIGWVGRLVYGLCHPEPIGWRSPIDWEGSAPSENRPYAAQGNATRIFFFEERPDCFIGWRVIRRQAFSCLAYLLSGGFSRPALIPDRSAPWVARLDLVLSRWPRVFGARCLIILQRSDPETRA